MIQLRPYQSELVESIRDAYRAGKRAPLVVLPTGGGKTTIFSYVTDNAAKRDKCVFLIAHRAELIKQISATLARFGRHHQIIAAGPVVRQAQVANFKATGKTFTDPKARVYVCSAQTLVKRFDTIADEPDLIIIDEAHHLVEGTTWGAIAERYPSARLLPVTATPCRLDGKGLGVADGGFADELLLGPVASELIADGYLSRYRIFAPPNALDLSAVKTRAGDYAKEQLADAVDKPTITGDAVQHYQRLCAGKRAVAFCVNVAHAEHVAAEFRAAGIAAASLDGSMDAGERDAVIKAFEAGEALVLTSAEIVSEGFDLPAIEAAILLRPTQSLALFLQQVGRALRVFPGKQFAIILDHVGAIARHGLPDDDREWSLAGVKKRKKGAADDGADVKVQTCLSCFAIYPPAPACPVCGHVQPMKERKIQHDDGELIELTEEQIDAMRRQKMRLQGQAQTVDQLMQQGISRSRAIHIVEARQAKQALQDEIIDMAGGDLRGVAGISLYDLRNMKPKALKELRQRLIDEKAINSAA